MHRAGQKMCLLSVSVNWPMFQLQLSDSSRLPRESKKSSLADYIWSLPPQDVQNALCHKTWSTLCWMVVLFRANSCDRVDQLITIQQVHTQLLLLANIGKPPLSLINCTHLRTQGYQGTGCGTQKYLSVKQVEHTTFH